MLQEKSIVTKITEFENGEMGDAEKLMFFQELVNTGIVWELQGTYARSAMELIKAGAITDMRC